MDAKQLQKEAVDAVGGQLEKAVEGLDAEGWHKKVNDQCLSPLEAFQHLAACYDMYSATQLGEKREWGDYKCPGTTHEEVFAAWKAEREKAVELMMASEEYKALHEATEYITLHDAYHVGQLCSLRLTLDPEWNAYAIYQ